MDEVVEEVEKVKKEFDETSKKAEDYINSIQEYGKTGVGLSSATAEEKSSLPRLNGLAQDSLNLLQSLQFKLDLLAPQLPTDDQVQDAQFLAESWKKHIHRYEHSFFLKKRYIIQNNFFPFFCSDDLFIELENWELDLLGRRRIHC